MCFSGYYDFCFSLPDATLHLLHQKKKSHSNRFSVLIMCFMRKSKDENCVALTKEKRSLHHVMISLWSRRFDFSRSHVLCGDIQHCILISSKIEILNLLIDIRADRVLVLLTHKKWVHQDVMFSASLCQRLRCTFLSK